jgi:Ca-activated chloride channel family protein
MKLKVARVFSAVALAVILPAVSMALYQQQESANGKAGDIAAKTTQPVKDDDKKPQKEDKKVTRGQDQPNIVLNTNLVSVTVTVTDTYGRFVTGLAKDQFEVYDDKVKQAIAHFSDDDAPVSLGIVYDVSGSMKERIHRSMHALKRFIETSHDEDDFFLLAFNNRANLVQDFTVSADKLLGHLMFVQPHGSTALYDAAYLAVEKIKQGRHPKKALLIISDGQDNNSRYTYAELRKRVKESDVQIYAIGITDPAGDSLAGVGRSILEEITRMTGGRAFFPNAFNEPELVEICTRIALELRHQYAIGFYPTDIQSEAKWHKVQIKVKPPKGLGRLSVDYKDGYQSFQK